MNQLKTIFLLTLLGGLFAWCGSVLGGVKGLITAFGLSLAICLYSWFMSDRIVLSSYRAQLLKPLDAPEVFEIVKNLSSEAKLSMPKLYVLPSAAANAFATGRNPKHSAIAVTHGLVKLLNKEELSGVLAHELAHIKSRDTLISTVAATICGALTTLVSFSRFGFVWGGERDERDRDNPLPFLIMVIIMPIVAALIRFSISRAREYSADAYSAKLCKTPDYLISALMKLDSVKGKYSLYEASPASLHIFIIRPVMKMNWAGIFSTHPSTEERIQKLEQYWQ